MHRAANCVSLVIFAVGFVLGEKAFSAARDSDLPASVLELIENAKKYPEGRGLRLEVRRKREAALNVARGGE